MAESDIGLIGLAIMGQNLVLNMSDHGFRVVVYNRTTLRVDEFVGGLAAGRDVYGSKSLVDFVTQLKKPHRVMLTIQAGAAAFLYQRTPPPSASWTASQRVATRQPDSCMA